MSDTKTTDSRHAAMRMALAVSAALAWSTVSGDVFRAVFGPGALFGIGYARAILAALSDVAVMLVLVSLAGWRHPLAALGLAGVRADVAQPLVWAALVFMPAVAACLIVASPAGGVSAADIGWQAVGAPFVEEVLYRGLAVGVLMRWCGWHWLAACLWPALFFGAAHLWQGEDLTSMAMVVAITGFGGVLFGWLFVRWGFNLWPAVLLHIGMNALWLIFDLGEDAVGGVAGNVIRFGVIALAVGLTFAMTRRRVGESSIA